MYRIIKASKSYEDLGIRTYRFHTENAPAVFETCSEEQSNIVRQAYQSEVTQNKIHGKIVRIPIESLVTDQISNKVENLKNLYQEANSVARLENISPDLPVVVQYEGTNYLLDGNHRATLIYALGGDTLKCRFFQIS